MVEYDSGDRIRIYTLEPFKTKATGTPYDPEIVRVVVREPFGPPRTFVYQIDDEVVRLGIGSYELELDVDMPGQYWFRFEGEREDGANQGAAEGGFWVNRSKAL